MRFLIFLACCLAVAGCGGNEQAAPFEGHWRKYDDPRVQFVKFNAGQITIGDKDASQSGTYSFTTASTDEPLYTITARLPDRTETFELYYEEDTVDLFFEDEARSGLYEITFNVPE